MERIAEILFLTIHNRMRKTNKTHSDSSRRSESDSYTSGGKRKRKSRHRHERHRHHHQQHRRERDDSSLESKANILWRLIGTNFMVLPQANHGCILLEVLRKQKEGGTTTIPLTNVWFYFSHASLFYSNAFILSVALSIGCSPNKSSASNLGLTRIEKLFNFN